VIAGGEASPALTVSAPHYENFPVASFAVPRSLRGAVLAIYGFARAADDLADEGEVAPGVRLAALDRYDRALADIRRGIVPGEPPFPALAAAVARHRLPLGPFHDLLSAFRQDVTVARYDTFANLLDYCRRSANPIGRLLLALYGVAGDSALRASDAICTALQLVNFWQDIAADWQRGRVYLPREDLARFGVDEAQIGAGRCDDAWRALLAFETARTRALLESGRALTRALPWRLSLELAGVLAGGHWILDAIDAAGGDVFRHRPRITQAAWIAIAWRALFPARRHRRIAVAGMA
jgi:squalene synthase HpnC